MKTGGIGKNDMRVAKDFIRKNRKSFWFALLMNLAFLAFLLLFTRPDFESNDDLALACFFNRSRVSVDAWTDLAGYPYGALLIFLYGITSKIPWHSVVMYLVALLSMSAVTCVIQKRFRGSAAMFLSFLLMVFFGYECFIVINFTRVSACATAAGVFLIFSSMTDEKKGILQTIIGACFVFAGYSIRTNEGMGVGLAMTSGGIYLLLDLFGRDKKGRRLKTVLRYALLLLPVAAFMAGAIGMDSYALHSSPEREYYKEYSDARTRLMDHDFPAYAPNQETYEKLGINQNAWKLYRTWNFYDPDKFSVDVMKQVAALSPQQKITKDTIRSFFKTYPERFTRNPMFLVYLFVVCLILFFGRRRWSVLLTIIYQFLLLTATELYLYADNRFGLMRVELGLWFGATLILLLMLDSEKFTLDGRSALLLMVLALILDQPQWQGSYRRQQGKALSQREASLEVTKQLAADKDHLYLCNISDYPISWSYGPFEAMPEGIASNIIPLGSWSAASKPYVDTMAAYGVRNPYKDMIGNDKVRVVASRIKTILTYLHDYYDPDCTAEPVGQAGSAVIYEIHD